MREIKFRGWYDDSKTCGKFDAEQFMFVEGDKYGTGDLDCIRFFNDGQPITLMQYIDSKDICGVEIYEGDIVSVSGIKGLFEVELEGLRGAILLDSILVNSYLEFIKEGRKITIIGNKYESPELLEQLR